MARIERAAPATARPSVLGWILLWMGGFGALFATLGLQAFERFFIVDPKFQGSARASLFLCGASVVALLLSVYRFIFPDNHPLNLSVPKNVNTPLSFALAMFIGWLIGTTVFR
jgi:hypothetical protein